MVFMPRFSVAIVDLQKYVLLPLIGPGHHGVALRVERDGWIINVIIIRLVLATRSPLPPTRRDFKGRTRRDRALRINRRAEARSPARQKDENETHHRHGSPVLAHGRPKELIELTLPIRKRVSPLATFAQFGLVLDAKLIRSGMLQPDSDPGISLP